MFGMLIKPTAASACCNEMYDKAMQEMLRNCEPYSSLSNGWIEHIDDCYNLFFYMLYLSIRCHQACSEHGFGHFPRAHDKLLRHATRDRYSRLREELIEPGLRKKFDAEFQASYIRSGIEITERQAKVAHGIADTDIRSIFFGKSYEDFGKSREEAKFVASEYVFDFRRNRLLSLIVRPETYEREYRARRLTEVSDRNAEVIINIFLFIYSGLMLMRRAF